MPLAFAVALPSTRKSTNNSNNHDDAQDASEPHIWWVLVEP